jgi:Zn-dependent M28 family amino/carboxypeptidase
MIYKTYRIFYLSAILFLIAIILPTCVSTERQSDFEIPVFSDQFQRYVEILSSDSFEGRAPTTPGGKKTKAFIESEFRRIGLKPANGSSYRQAVPLVEINMKNFSDLVITSEENDTLSYSYIDQMVIGTTRLTDSVRVVDSELVFAGYGIVAPEYNWNDYDGLDVRGKTVVVLVNDPGYELGDVNLFTGTAMTYYGRWTYKYEEAARQGATGVLIVHETGPAGYGWDVVKNSWTGPQFEVGGNSNGPATEMQGWIQQDVAEEIFEAAGMTLAEAKQQAQNPGFKLFSLDLKTSFSFDVKHVQSQSYNIAGYVEGSEYPDETIIYMAHWDHLGKVETPDGPRIYNGAIDNATGTAAIMAIAEKFAAMDPAPKRSVVFIAVTAEESGLIGSRYYAQNPLFPVETTVGGINIDGLNVYGPTNDLVVIGYNASQLQETLKRHAADQERVLVPEKYPERGYFYRSDHFNLVREGVPMIYANSGEDFIGKDESFARFVKEDMEMRYHSPMDVINENWNWNGLHQNLWLFYNVGKELANSDDWPEWNEGSEFKAIRETSEHLRR